jgi:membrane fusion protein, heavy metal efflux system
VNTTRTTSLLAHLAGHLGLSEAGCQALLLGLVSLALLSGCGSAATQAISTKPPEAQPASNPLEVAVTPEILAQLQIGEPGTDAILPVLRAPARVEADEMRASRVSSPVTGKVTDLDVIEGQTVRMGQVMATLHSTELSDAQAALLKALNQQQLAARAAARAKQLLEAGVIGEAEVQRREADLGLAGTEVAAMRGHLGVLGMAEDAIGSVEKTGRIAPVTPLLATRDGIVLERRITPGQVIQKADVAIVIADLSQVWVVADVPERSAGQLVVGKPAEAEIDAFPGSSLLGEISYISPTVTPEIRTIRVRMALQNPNLRFKPGMLATMLLPGAAERKVVLPATAVVREENRDHVFIQTGDAKFLLRPVELDDAYRERRIVTSGLAKGEKVVLVGAFHLNNLRKGGVAHD